MDELIFTNIPEQEFRSLIKESIREELNQKIKAENPSKNEDDLITCNEACKLYGVSKVTLFKWRKNGIIPFYRIGGKRILFKKKELIEALKLNSKSKIKNRI